MFGRRKQLETGHEESRVTAVKFIEALVAPTAPVAVTRDALARAAAARQAKSAQASVI